MKWQFRRFAGSESDKLSRAWNTVKWSRDVGPGPSSSHIVAHQTVGTSEIPWLLARFVGLAKQKVRSERSERSSAGYSREIRAD